MGYRRSFNSPIQKNIKQHFAQPNVKDTAYAKGIFSLLKTLPYSIDQMFLTEEIINEKKIGTGDEIYITGLFHKVTGKKRNLPIVRMGSVAMMENEPIEKTKLGPM